MSHGRGGAFVSVFQDCPRMLPVLSDLPEVSYFPCCQLIQVGLRKTGWTGLNLKSVEMHVNLVSVGLPRQTWAPELRAVQQLRFWSDHESPLPVWDCQGHFPLLFRHWGWGRRWRCCLRAGLGACRARDPLSFLPKHFPSLPAHVLPLVPGKPLASQVQSVRHDAEDDDCRNQRPCPSDGQEMEPSLVVNSRGIAHLPVDRHGVPNFFLFGAGCQARFR